jgi:hypothetical protein
VTHSFARPSLHSGPSHSSGGQSQGSGLAPSQVRSCGICGGQSGTGAGFPKYFNFSWQFSFHRLFHILQSFYQQRYVVSTLIASIKDQYFNIFIEFRYKIISYAGIYWFEPWTVTCLSRLNAKVVPWSSFQIFTHPPFMISFPSHVIHCICCSWKSIVK